LNEHLSSDEKYFERKSRRIGKKSLVFGIVFNPEFDIFMDNYVGNVDVEKMISFAS
jgi:hypothetical protein